VVKIVELKILLSNREIVKTKIKIVNYFLVCGKISKILIYFQTKNKFEEISTMRTFKYQKQIQVEKFNIGQK
jgi:hypothetical protein